MKKFLALVLALIMVLGLVACGGGGTSSTPATPGTTPTQPSNPTPGTTPSTPETPKTPSRTDVKLSINTAWTTSDPMASNNVQDNLIYWNMSDYLVFMNEATGQIEYRVAKSHTVSADGLVYTFELRDDVKFHNGDPVKAADVVYSLNRSKDSRRSGTATKAMADIVATGEYTVQITLSEPYAPLLPGLCPLPILNEKVVTEQGDKFGSIAHLAGCGPYKLVKMEADSEIVLEAFEDYYRGSPAIKTINYSVITDSATATVALESGDLDWYNCSVTDYTRIMAEGKFAGESLTANHLTYMGINGASKNAPALADKRVRQAICYAINLTELNYAAFDGAGGEAIYMMDPKANYAFPTSGVNTYEHNIAKAKALLTEAGYPNGVNVGKLLCFTGSYFESVATMAQAQLEAAGIHADLEWNEQATVVARGKVQDYDLFICGVTWNGDASHFTNYACSDARGGGYIYQGDDFDHDSLMGLKKKAAQSSDANERMKLYAEIHNYAMDYACIMPLLHKAVPIVYDKNLNAVNYPAYQQVFEWSWN